MSAIRLETPGTRSYDCKVIGPRLQRPTKDKHRLAFRNCPPSLEQEHAALREEVEANAPEARLHALPPSARRGPRSSHMCPFLPVATLRHLPRARPNHTR